MAGMQPFDSFSVTSGRLTRRRWLGLATLAVSAFSWAAVLALTLAGAYVQAVGALTLVGLATLVAGPQLLVWASPASLEGRGGPARVTVAERAIRIERSSHVRIIAPNEIQDGWRGQRGSEHFAWLRLRHGELVSIGVPDAATAERVLAACGTAAQMRAVALSLPHAGRVGRQMAGCALPATALVMVSSWIGFASDFLREPSDFAQVLTPLIACFIGVLVMRRCVRALQATTVVVGTDGVVVRVPGERQGFVPHSDLAAVEVAPATVTPGMPLGTEHGRAVILRMRNGATLRVPTATAEDANTLCARIRAAVAGVGGESSALEAALLERRGRDLAQWKSELGAMLSRRPSYRERACDAEQLAALCESPRESPEHRAAAAVALGASGDPGMRQRLRIAAAGCAHPKLRIALEAAADGAPVEDAALDELSRESRA